MASGEYSNRMKAMRGNYDRKNVRSRNFNQHNVSFKNPLEMHLDDPYQNARNKTSNQKTSEFSSVMNDNTDDLFNKVYNFEELQTNYSANPETIQLNMAADCPLNANAPVAQDVCTGRHLRQLELKQKAMEASMRRLLRSMRDLKMCERENGYTSELEKRRKLKLTRMIQILMLQRRNMQLQNDTLRKEVITLTRKFMGLRKRAERLVVENVNMRKYYSEAKSDNDNKSLQIENLLQGKVMMQKQVQDKVDMKVEIENLKFEIKRLLVENHNYKDSMLRVERDLIRRSKEKEAYELENSELKSKLIKLETEEANLRLRFERLTFENNRLLKETECNQNNKCDITMMTFEYDKLREKHQETIRNYERLERMFIQESDQRKLYHNQLQELKGNIRVLVRCKPIRGDESVPWNFKSTDKIVVPTHYLSLLNGDSGCYTFNRVFRPNSKQSEVFEEVKGLLSSCIDGFNVCIMAYGPTGSGKTYTMQGSRDEPGITLHAISELSELCDAVKNVWEIKTIVSMLEIYNEVIYDLLNKRIQAVRLCDDGTDVRVVDVEQKVALTETEILYWIAKGHKRRKAAETKMNLESSRSHLIIRIEISMTSIIDKRQRNSTLIFCDLAGSENAEYVDGTKKQAVETGYINKSLVVLGRVFEALRKRTATVPYRESKLTHLLKPCLGGQAKCVLIVALSSDSNRVDRSVKALQFGARTMQISLGPAKPNIKCMAAKFSPRLENTPKSKV